MMSEQKQTVAERWVFAGNVDTVSGKTGHKFYPVVNGRADFDRPLVYNLGRQSRIVGGMYNVEVDANAGERTTIYADTMSFTGMYHDGEQVREWRARQAALEQLKRAAKMEAKYRGEVLPDSFEEIAEMHSHLSFPDAIEFEKVVMAQLRKLSWKADQNRRRAKRPVA